MQGVGCVCHLSNQLLANYIYTRIYIYIRYISTLHGIYIYIYDRFVILLVLILIAVYLYYRRKKKQIFLFVKTSSRVRNSLCVVYVFLYNNKKKYEPPSFMFFMVFVLSVWMCVFFFCTPCVGSD